MSLLASSALASGCRDVARAFGPSSAAAATRASQLFSAFGERYTNVTREPKYDVARTRIAEAALIPSRVFNDTASWTVLTGSSTRTLFVAAEFSDGKYRFGARKSVDMPHAVAEGRHVIVLNRTGEQQYVWDTDVDFAVGSLTPTDVDAFFTALFAASEHRGEGELRADYRAAFPRTTVALGRLVSLDSLVPVNAADGSTSMTMVAHMEPKRIEQRFPLFAKWLSKYIGSARYRFRLTDHGGATWLTADGADARLTLRFRSLHGRLLPLAGPARAMPDTLQLLTDFTMKVKIFTVGVRNMVSDFRITREPNERSVVIVSRRDPDWSLPLITARLIRSSLQFPFQGTGIVLALGVRDKTPGAQSILNRRSHLAVQESGVLRFLAGLATHAVSEFDAGAEAEQDVFLRELFGALEADVHGVLRASAGDIDER